MTIVPVQKGATVIEVMAQNSEGSAVQRISVTVGSAVPPLAYALDTVAATKYQFTNPQDVVVDGDGNLYVVESLLQRGHRIHKVDAATGTITLIAGTGEDGYGGDGGPAIEAQLNQPEGLAVDGRGNVYVADFLNHRIRKVDAATGTINTIAGTGEQGYSGDGGPATEAMLAFPRDVAVDDAGNVYISDDARIRKVDAFTGIINTIAGRGYVGGPVGEGDVGDGGPATEAQLGDPFSVAVDGAGNVYITDVWNHRIRRVDAFTGIINTIAGTGEQLCCQHGSPATEIRVSFPNGLAVDAFGNVYFTETWGTYISDISGRSE